MLVLESRVLLTQYVDNVLLLVVLWFSVAVLFNSSVIENSRI